MPFNVSEVYSGSRALLNDQDNNVYTNTVQFPYLKIAANNLRMELELNNIPVTNRTSGELAIDEGITDIGGPTGPPLPMDLIEPFALWERTSGTNNDFLLMDRRQFLPKNEVLTSFLQVWEYSNQVIQLLGANSDIEVKLDYIGDPLNNIVNENTQVVIINSENYLKFRLASLCAYYIGENESRSKELLGEAGNALELLLNCGIKGSQSIYTRRRPFRSRAKSNSSISR